MRGESVPVIFGIKLKQFREERGFPAKEFARRAGLSVSYLNEIEKGKKYPKSDKIIQIAGALELPYDDLVSLKLDQGLNSLESLLDSPVLRELPLELFGISQQDVISLVTKAPKKAVALVRTLDEMARSYNVEVEHFFHAMLRSYQEAHENFFEEIETEAEKFVKGRGWDPSGANSRERLASVLTGEFGVTIDEATIDLHPELSIFRSIWVEGEPNRLLINSRLTPAQKAFQIGREIGYRLLGLEERGVTSSRAEVTSFEQVLNDFKASYFAGALLLNQWTLVEELGALFQVEKWDPQGFLSLMAKHGVTPEIFLYRLTQLIPQHFHLQDFHFLRFGNAVASENFTLSKQFNMSRVLLPQGIGQNEHYCRRWSAVNLLSELEAHQNQGDIEAPIVNAQVAKFTGSDTEYFYITLARPFALTPNTNTAVSLGFRLTEAFKATVGFWNDPAVSHVAINETCERCTLTPEMCGERVAPPVIEKRLQARKERKRVLEELLLEPKRALPTT